MNFRIIQADWLVKFFGTAHRIDKLENTGPRAKTNAAAKAKRVLLGFILGYIAAVIALVVEQQ